MNTVLLRLGTRNRRLGTISFAVPGAPHPITLQAPRTSFWGVWTWKWPAYSDADGLGHRDGWTLRGARLDWHGRLARTEIRKLLREGTQSWS